jgi:hypothetical protein
MGVEHVKEKYMTNILNTVEGYIPSLDLEEEDTNSLVGIDVVVPFLTTWLDNNCERDFELRVQKIVEDSFDKICEEDPRIEIAFLTEDETLNDISSEGYLVFLNEKRVMIIVDLYNDDGVFLLSVKSNGINVFRIESYDIETALETVLTKLPSFFEYDLA